MEIDEASNAIMVKRGKNGSDMMDMDMEGPQMFYQCENEYGQQWVLIQIILYKFINKNFKFWNK